MWQVDFEKKSVTSHWEFSLVLSRNVITFQHLIIQYSFNYLSTGCLQEVTKEENFTFLALKVVAVAYKRFQIYWFDLENGILENWLQRRGGPLQVVVATRGLIVFLIRVPVSGHMSSSSLTIPSPCFSVHIFIGEPPPIFWYCSWILGVLLLAIHAAILLEIIH